MKDILCLLTSPENHITLKYEYRKGFQMPGLLITLELVTSPLNINKPTYVKKRQRFDHNRSTEGLYKGDL